MIDISFPDHSCGLSFDDTYLPEALKYSYNNEIEKSKIIIDKAKISIGLFAANGVFAFLNAFNIDSEKYVQKTKKVDELLKILFDDTIPKQIKEETINLFSLPREEVMEIAEIQNVRELLNGISIVLIAVAFLGTLLSLSFSVKINTTSRKKSHQTMFPPEISHDNRFSSSETNENYSKTAVENYFSQLKRTNSSKEHFLFFSYVALALAIALQIISSSSYATEIVLRAFHFL